MVFIYYCIHIHIFQVKRRRNGFVQVPFFGQPLATPCLQIFADRDPDQTTKLNTRLMQSLVIAEQHQFDPKSVRMIGMSGLLGSHQLNTLW